MAATSGASWHDPCRVITQPGRYGFDTQTKWLTLLSLHPGVTVEEVQASSDFEILIADNLSVTGPPGMEEQRIPREIDPNGMVLGKWVRLERANLWIGLSGRIDRFYGLFENMNSCRRPDRRHLAACLSIHRLSKERQHKLGPVQGRDSIFLSEPSCQLSDHQGLRWFLVRLLAFYRHVMLTSSNET